MTTTTTTHVRATDIEERWFLFDASQHTLGKMSADIAHKLTGKDLPTYTASELCGAHVVVINGGQAKVSGIKETQKEYQHYTGYPGGLKSHTLEEMRVRRPNDIVKLAVRRMLPKTRLGHKMLSRLKVYPGTDHPHSAQQPVLVEKLR